MNNLTRRRFIEKSVLAGAAGIVAPSIAGSTFVSSTPRLIKDDISLAQWALLMK